MIPMYSITLSLVKARLIEIGISELADLSVSYRVREFLLETTNFETIERINQELINLGLGMWHYQLYFNNLPIVIRYDSDGPHAYYGTYETFEERNERV